MILFDLLTQIVYKQSLADYIYSAGNASEGSSEGSDTNSHSVSFTQYTAYICATDN